MLMGGGALVSLWRWWSIYAKKQGFLRLNTTENCAVVIGGQTLDNFRRTSPHA